MHRPRGAHGQYDNPETAWKFCMAKGFPSVFKQLDRRDAEPYHPARRALVRQGRLWALRNVSMILRMIDKEVNGVSVVTLDGRIILGEESYFLREKLKSLLAKGKKKIVLNMADSAGLGILVAAHVSAETHGASVRLCHLGKKFHEVMQMTRILTIFDVYDTEEEALASF